MGRSIWMAERNLYLADELVFKNAAAVQDKPGDFARLFDLVVNQFNELTSSNIPKMVRVCNVILESFRGLRAYFLSLHEANTSSYRNALALNRLALSCISNSTVSNYEKILPESFLKKLTQYMTTSVTQLELAEFQLRAYITSDHGKSSGEADEEALAKKVYGTKDNPLVNDINNADVLLGRVSAPPDLNLVQFPPAMKTTMVKPVLFDVAESYIEFPDFSDMMPKSSAGGQGDGKSLVGK